jgi:hypothetical protein
VEKRPAGESAGMPIPFRRGRSPVEKLGTRPRTWRAKPGRRLIRGALSLGYFSLGKQRKVTRPPAGGRNARRVGGQIATTRQSNTEALDPGLRRDDGEEETLRRAPTPHPNPLPIGEREKSMARRNTPKQQAKTASALRPRHRIINTLERHLAPREINRVINRRRHLRPRHRHTQRLGNLAHT